MGFAIEADRRDRPAIAPQDEAQEESAFEAARASWSGAGADGSMAACETPHVSEADSAIWFG